jgi:hypothetical protein
MLGDRDSGRALVIEDGARVLALSPSGSDHNVLWNHPALRTCTSRKDFSTVGLGGMGGIRLWHSPEIAYMWKGAPQPETFANYQVQEAMDPGAHAITETTATSCQMIGSATMIDWRTEARVTFEMERTISVAPLEESWRKSAAGGVKLRMENRLHLKTGDESTRVDLWHLMQLPGGATIGARVKPGTRPDLYFGPADEGWEVAEGCFSWRTDGKRMAKLGLGHGSLTDGPFAITKTGANAGVFLWQVPIRPEADYVDAPPGQSRNDQVLQFFDGLSFCEVEYHSPGASLKNREVVDVSELTYLEIPAGGRDALKALVTLPALL